MGFADGFRGIDAERSPAPSRHEAAEPVPPNLARLDALMIPASERLADWRTIRITVPEDASATSGFADTLNRARTESPDRLENIT